MYHFQKSQLFSSEEFSQEKKGQESTAGRD